jgi:transcriptional regulator
MLSRIEKEQRVIDLYQQGKTIREIAQDVHMSFGDIGAIVRKATGPVEDNNNNIPLTTLSKDSQAFALFSDGKKPIEVAIKWILELM